MHINNRLKEIAFLLVLHINTAAQAEAPDPKDKGSLFPQDWNSSGAQDSNNSSSQADKDKDKQEDDADSVEKKYGSIAPSVKRLDATLKEAQQVLGNTEFAYFQNKLNTMKQNAASVVSRGMKPFSYLEPMKALESELSSSLATARQSCKENKEKIGESMSHLRNVFAERRNSLSRADQESFLDMIADLQDRTNTVTSGAEAAGRISTLAEEAATMETTIIGRTMFDSKPNAPPPRRQSTDGRRSIEESRSNAEKQFSWPKPGTRLGPMPPEHKPSLSMLTTQIETLIKQLTDRGELGSMDKDQFERRLSGQKKIVSEASGKVSQLQESAIREELEQIMKELKELARSSFLF